MLFYALVEMFYFMPVLLRSVKFPFTVNVFLLFHSI